MVTLCLLPVLAQFVALGCVSVVLVKMILAIVLVIMAKARPRK